MGENMQTRIAPLFEGIKAAIERDTKAIATNATQAAQAAKAAQRQVQSNNRIQTRASLSLLLLGLAIGEVGSLLNNN
jgi:hypothetical protein